MAIPIKSGLKVSDFIQAHIHSDPRKDICDQLQQTGFEIPKQLLIGRLTRIDGPDDRKGKQSGWLVYHELDDSAVDGAVFGVAVWGSWKTGEKHSWSSKQAHHMTMSERVAYNTQLEAIKAETEREQAEAYARCATEAQSEWTAYSVAKDTNAYLAAKKLAPVGDVRQDDNRDGCLLVPVLQNGVLAGYQRIWTDRKRFKTGTQKKGGYFVLNGTTDRVFIAEGYATAVSVHLATGCTVYVAFDAGNLYNIANFAKEKHGQSVVIAADNDHGSGANTGINAAEQIKSGLGIGYIIPNNGHKDFDDWRQAEGIDALKKALCFEPKRFDLEKKQELKYDTPSGVLADIVGFYNATSGNNQPLFAIQSAIACASIMLGRCFCTRTGIFSMVYLINVAETGTGKEHPKRVIEQILSETGNANLIGGDGYTAGAAVLSTLINRPRHLTIIDEFAHYLEVSRNKNDSIAKTANSELMQVFGRPDGTQRAKNYSMLTSTKDVKDAMSKLFVHKPHITMLAMSTPEKLFNTLGIESVNDGFLNRFLVCVSDEKPDIRRHKDRMPVPKSITDWADKIKARRGSDIESPTVEPKLIELSFSHDAMVMQEDFQRYWLDQRDRLKKVGLENITNRANEISMRLALIHALSVNPHADIVSTDDLSWAISWTKYNFNRLIDELKMCVSGSEFEGQKKEALKAIRVAGHNGVSFAKMQKTPPFSRYKRKDLAEILQALEDAELIAYNMRTPTALGGRPSKTYFAIEAD